VYVEAMHRDGPWRQLDGFARVNGQVVLDGTMTFALGPRRDTD